MRDMAAALTLLLVALVLSACGTESRQARAQAVAEGYLKAVKARDLNRALTFFAPRYLETRSPEGLKLDIRIITTRLGDLKTFRLTAARWRMDFIPPESGTHFTLEYEVQYARHPARETFFVRIPFTRREPKILNHALVSPGFIER